MFDESTGTSRGEFLKRTAGVTGLVVGAGVIARGARAAPQVEPAPGATATPLAGRAFVSGSFSLELDGSNAGLLRSFAGGDTRAPVIEEPVGQSYFSRKRIGSPSVDDFTVEVGLAMGDAFFEWVENTLTGLHPRRNGAILTADFASNARSRRTFRDALISEVAFPAFDASSKDVATMTVTFTSEESETLPATGKVALPVAKQKQWLVSNFALEIDGLDTSRVTRVDEFAIRQKVVQDQVGEGREPIKVPGKLEFPNLRITLSEQGSQSWFEWFEDFVLLGNSGNDDERNGTLRFLAPSLDDELGQVRLFNLGIFALGAETMEAGAVKRLVAELYCERMELEVA
jgi:hypothetical protein